MRFTLYSNDPNCRSVLIYLFETNAKVQEGECVNAMHVVQSLYTDWERDFDIQLFGVSNGVHDLQYQEHTFKAFIHQFIDNRKLFTTNDYRNPEIIKEVILEGETLTAEVMKQLCTEATKFVQVKFKECFKTNHKNIKKYIYVAKEGYWDLMNNTQARSLDTLFLKKGEKEELLHFVHDFLSDETKADYDKFNIPYKANILLYGKPGTGKTSTILAIASELKLNIGLIPISKCLDDTKLIHAMNSVKKHDCKIIVLEDIDCLFMNRKECDTFKNSLTLSGLLNCLDGLFRNDGIIVFMTANNITTIDEAMLRSSRIDYKLYYDFADEYQTKQCFSFYFPTKADQFERFYEEIQYKQFTISMLQQFFFKHRKQKDLTKYIPELVQMIQFSEKPDEEEHKSNASRHLYM